MSRTRQELQVEKENAALALRRDAKSYREIAAALGWRSPQAAQNAVEKALGREPIENRDQVRRLELEKLDAREQGLLVIMRATPYVAITSGVKAGGVVNGPDGAPLVDPGPWLAADKGMDRIAIRRAAMLGLDEPRKATLTVVTEDMLDREIAALEAQLAQPVEHGDRSASREDRALANPPEGSPQP